MTHYERLGVAATATTHEVRAAWRTKVTAAHTDRGGDAAAMRDLVTARDVLLDPVRRALYDAELASLAAHPPAAPTGVLGLIDTAIGGLLWARDVVELLTPRSPSSKG